MNNTAEQQAPPATSLKSIFRSAPKVEATTKSKTPTLTVDSETTTLATEILELKRKFDDLEAQVKTKSAQLIQKIGGLRADMCKREYISSVRIPTANGQYVVAVWSSNYIKIKPENEAQLMQIVGGDGAYQNYFKSSFVITAKSEDKSETELWKLFEWLAPDDTEEGLKIGQERFAQFFKVEENIRPTEKFVHDHVQMSEAKREKLEMVGVKQYTPAIKTR